MSEQNLGSSTSRSMRDGKAWNVISWIAAVTGIMSMVMILIQALIVLAGIPKGDFWTVLIAVTSPGLPVSAVGLLCGAIGCFSAYRRRALIGIIGFVVTLLAFAILDVTIGGH